MFYVYILRSISNPKQRYVGISLDLVKRLNEHNQGKCEYSKRYRPWKIETYIGFTSKKKAIKFERY